MPGSPTTTSRRGTSVTRPSRTTFTGCSSPRAVSTLNLRAASISNTKPTVVAMKMARKMPRVSINSPLINASPNDTRAATSKIFIIGSLYFSR